MALWSSRCPLADRKPRLGWFRAASLGISLALLAFTAYAHAAKPDSLAAFTVYPVWFWAGPGLVWALGGFRLRRPLPSLVVAILWALFTLAFAEEARSLTRGGAWPDPVWVEAREKGRAIRVISLNCSIGDPRVAAEVGAYDPDLVLLQESPSRPEVRALAHSLFGEEGGFAWGHDASVVAKGKLREIATEETRPSVRLCEAQLSGGAKLAVACIRLHPSAFRMDLWSPECWSAFARTRARHREEVARLKELLDTRVPEGPLLVGGDMNSPAGDPAVGLLEPRVRDAFGDAGRGWGATFLNEFPLVRIDQVWVDRSFRAVAVVVKKTRFSDHRMVICDLMLYER